MRAHVDLFSGIGGFSLAARWAGVETIAFAEIEPYASRVLERHFSGVRNYGDVRNVPAISDVWLVTGGVPCQPASVAGKRRGTEDDRWLWPEALAAVEKIKPDWVCLENPLGILSLEKPVMSVDLAGYGNLVEAAISSEGDFWANVTGEVELVFRDLISSVEKLGYEVGVVVIPACGLGAWHRRYRVWILGHAASIQSRPEQQSSRLDDSGHASSRDADNGYGHVRDAQRNGQYSEIAKRKRELLKRPVTDGTSKTLPDADRARELQPQGRVKKQRGRTSNGGSTNAPNPNGGRAHTEPQCITEGESQANAGGDGEIRIVPNSDSSGLGEQRRAKSERTKHATAECDSWWAAEPDVGRVVDGLPARLDRLRGLGNAIVPQVAYQLIKRMIEAEDIGA